MTAKYSSLKKWSVFAVLIVAVNSACITQKEKSSFVKIDSNHHLAPENFSILNFESLGASRDQILSSISHPIFTDIIASFRAAGAAKMTPSIYDQARTLSPIILKFELELTDSFELKKLKTLVGSKVFPKVKSIRVNSGQIHKVSVRAHLKQASASLLGKKTIELGDIYILRDPSLSVRGSFEKVRKYSENLIMGFNAESILHFLGLHYSGEGDIAENLLFSAEGIMLAEVSLKTFPQENFESDTWRTRMFYENMMKPLCHANILKYRKKEDCSRSFESALVGLAFPEDLDKASMHPDQIALPVTGCVKLEGGQPYLLVSAPTAFSYFESDNEAYLFEFPAPDAETVPFKGLSHAINKNQRVSTTGEGFAHEKLCTSQRDFFGIQRNGLKKVSREQVLCLVYPFKGTLAKKIDCTDRKLSLKHRITGAKQELPQLFLARKNTLMARVRKLESSFFE